MDRIELSNGTLCFGRPTTVIDGSDGREIVADPDRLRAALERIVNEQRTVAFAGQTDPERCSPTIVWAMRQWPASSMAAEIAVSGEAA